MARYDDDDLGEEAPDSARKRLIQAVTKRLQDPRKLSGDAMDVVSAVLETSDRAKSEAVKLVAREVRSYLEALKLKEDVQWLLTNHSLEMHVSMSLKPLADAAEPPGGSPSEPTGERDSGVE